MNGKVAARAWREIARLYLCIFGCFLVFAVILALIVHYSAIVYIRATDSNFAVVFWVALYTTTELMHSTFRVAAARKHAGKAFDIEHDEPLQLGRCVRGLCSRRGIKPPEVRIQESFDPIQDSAGSLIYGLFHRDVMSIWSLVAHCAPEKQLRALVAHELRHQDSSSILFRKAMTFILEVFWRTWLPVVIVTAAFLLIQGRFAASFAVYASGAVILSAFAVVTNYLVGMMSRFDEHKTDIASCLDTGDHQSFADFLAFSKYFRAQCAERVSLLVQLAAEQQPADDDNVRLAEIKVRWTLRLALQLAWFVLRNVPVLLILAAWAPYAIAVKMTGIPFSSHPSTEARYKLLARLFGPIEPWKPSAPSDDDERPGPGPMLTIDFGQSR